MQLQKSIAALRKKVEEVPPGHPSMQSLVMLTELNATHHKEMQQLAAKVDSMARQLAALSTPEAREHHALTEICMDAVKALQYIAEEEGDNDDSPYVCLNLKYSLGSSTHTFSISFIKCDTYAEHLRGVWGGLARAIPFVVNGLPHWDDLDEYPAVMVWWSAAEFKKAALPRLRSPVGGWELDKVYLTADDEEHMYNCLWVHE